MKSENLFTMKQPELGKKIVDLRKQKGLTQEELVEKCNINVRTIQRIEAGETTPRSYTLKNIFEVLGVAYEDMVKKEKKEFSISNDQLKFLKWSWVFGIGYFFAGFPAILSEYLKLKGFEVFGGFGDVVVKVIAIITFCFFIRGFFILGKVYNNQLLSITYIITLVAFVVFGVFEMVPTYNPLIMLSFSFPTKSILFGVLTILLGIGVVLLHKEYKTLAIITGSLEILTGIVLLLVFPGLGVFLLFPMQILEVILLYTAYDKFKKKTVLAYS